MPELSKEERIKAELDRITKFFEKADGNQRAIVTPLLQNASFMKVTLEDLQKVINTEGTTERYQNGQNQHGFKSSASLQAYNSLIKNYTSVIKSLSAILPQEEKQRTTTLLTSWEPKEKTPEEIEAERKEQEEHIKQINQSIQEAVERQRKERGWS